MRSPLISITGNTSSSAQKTGCIKQQTHTNKMLYLNQFFTILVAVKIEIECEDTKKNRIGQISCVFFEKKFAYMGFFV
jgi:hypothetical protein